MTQVEIHGACPRSDDGGGEHKCESKSTLDLSASTMFTYHVHVGRAKTMSESNIWDLQVAFASVFGFEADGKLRLRDDLDASILFPVWVLAKTQDGDLAGFATLGSAVILYSSSVGDHNEPDTACDSAVGCQDTNQNEQEQKQPPKQKRYLSYHDMWNVGVVPRFRRRGIGRGLVHHIKLLALTSVCAVKAAMTVARVLDTMAACTVEILQPCASVCAPGITMVGRVLLNAAADAHASVDAKRLGALRAYAANLLPVPETHIATQTLHSERSWVHFHVLHDNEDGLKFYRSIGARRLGPCPAPSLQDGKELPLNHFLVM
jgi:GNAT superfamily N-acetyltransferase